MTAGTVRFETPEGNVDAAEGQLMVVPPRAIHTFQNPSETEDAEFFMTATPGASSRHHCCSQMTAATSRDVVDFVLTRFASGYYVDCELSFNVR